MNEPRISLPPIEDANKYVKMQNVPVLDETADSSFDHKFLSKVVEETNARSESGDLILLTIGHTDDGPETSQPPLVGYAKNLTLSKFNGKDTVLADIYIQKDRYDESMTYPRRSAEVWHGKESGYIDIVSLLRRASKCDLGLLTCEKEGNRTIYNSPLVGEVMTKEEMEQLASIITSSLKENLTLSKFEKVEVKDEVAVEEVVKVNNEAPIVPGTIEVEQAQRMRSDSERIQLSRLEKRINELESERDYAKLQLRRSNRERDLKQLEAEGFQFDPVEELTLVETLEETAYTNHLDRVRKNYRKFPVGEKLIQTGEPRVGISKEDVPQVLKFAATNNIKDYGTALAQFKKEAN